jgi:hypothetical protein
MPTFLAKEKKRQAAAKQDRQLFSPLADREGPYSTKPGVPLYPFCLPVQAAAENLFEGVRTQIQGFESRGIPWHKGVGGGPTTHLCSSQVCCVNFLAPFADKPSQLLALVRAVFPDAAEMLPVDEGRGDYIEFEWIGDPNRDYLDEAPKRGRRTRGANCTSADAAVRFRLVDGREQVVLIEWKYCERYRDLQAIKMEARLLVKNGEAWTPSSQKRVDRYAGRLAAVAAVPAGLTFEDLYVEPLYQLMRQQLLAYEMESIGKEADVVSVLHLSPRANEDFKAITSPAVRGWAEANLPADQRNVVSAWSSLLKQSDRFRHAAIEDGFAPALASPDPKVAEWGAYVRARYSWVEAGTEQWEQSALRS